MTWCFFVLIESDQSMSNSSEFNARPVHWLCLSTRIDTSRFCLIASWVQRFACRQLLGDAVHIPTSNTDVLAPDTDDLALRKQ